MSVRYTDNGDGSFTLTGANGASEVFMDPDGSYRKELDAMSADTGGAITPDRIASLAPQAPATPPARGYIPPANKTLIAPRDNGPPPADMAAMLDADTAGTTASDVMAAAAPPAAPDAPLRIDVPGTPGKTTTNTTSGTSTSVTKGDPTGAIGKAGAELSEAQRKANQSAEEAQRTAIANNAKLLEETEARHRAEYAAQTKIENERKAAIEKTLAERKQLRETPLDIEAEMGDFAGAAALGATIGSAIANVGLAWMGQAARPITHVDDLINRATKLAVDRRNQLLDSNQEQTEASREELLDARLRARYAYAQMLDAEAGSVENENQAAALKALVDDNEAKIKRDELQLAEATADKVVTQTDKQTTTSSTSGEPGYSIVLPAGSDEEQAQNAILAKRFDVEASDGDKKALERLAEEAKHTEHRARVIQELEQLEKDGHVSAVVGLWHNSGFAQFPLAQAITRMTGTEHLIQSPEEVRAAQLLTELEGLNRFSWKTEPNSVKTQEKLATLGLPKNDRDLPTFFRTQKEAISETKQGLFAGTTDIVRGKFLTQRTGGKSQRAAPEPF